MILVCVSLNNLDNCNMDDDISDFECTPPNIANSAQKAALDVLSKKSASIYRHKYDIFMNWCKKNKITKYSENVLLAYFNDELKMYQPTTLWSIFSMLKSTLKIINGIDISSYHKLIAFIKQKTKGHKPKKSGIFEKHHFIKFILEAPDSKFLMIKVAFIVGISGACRREELMKMTINDIEDRETVLVVRIPELKNDMERIFTILNPNNSIDYLSYIKKYIALRPPYVDTPRLFLKYAENKCIKQPVGINTFGKMPSIIAAYLNLPNPAHYTGHCFRRSSATMLSNSGEDLLTVKKHGGWKSSKVTEGYIDNTISKKINVSKKILMSDSPNSSCSNVFSKSNDTVDNIIEAEGSNIITIDVTHESTYNAASRNNSLNAIKINDINKLNNIPHTSKSDIVCSNRTVVCENSQVKSTFNKAEGLNFNNCTNCTFNIHIVHN